MKICVFGTIHWNTKEEYDKQYYQLKEWFDRSIHYIIPSKLYLTSGSYVNIDENKLPVDIIQTKLTKTKQQNDDWNYWKLAFNVGLYHSLLNVNDYDILIHCQSNFLLGEDILPKLIDFYNSEKQLFATKISSFWGFGIETGFMALKRDAVHRYINQQLRCNLSDQPTICVEKEMFELFKDDWYNPYPILQNVRKNITHSFNKDPQIYRDFSISDEKFLQLPFILGEKHCSKEDVMLWCKEHPLK